MESKENKDNKFVLVNDDSSIYEIDNECMKRRKNGEECSDNDPKDDNKKGPNKLI